MSRPCPLFVLLMCSSSCLLLGRAPELYEFSGWTLWLCFVSRLCPPFNRAPVWLGSMSRPCPPLGRVRELCEFYAWALCLGFVAQTIYCQGSILRKMNWPHLLVAPLNSVVGRCSFIFFLIAPVNSVAGLGRWALYPDSIFSCLGKLGVDHPLPALVFLFSSLLSFFVVFLSLSPPPFVFFSNLIVVFWLPFVFFFSLSCLYFIFSCPFGPPFVLLLFYSYIFSFLFLASSYFRLFLSSFCYLVALANLASSFCSFLVFLLTSWPLLLVLPSFGRVGKP